MTCKANANFDSPARHLSRKKLKRITAKLVSKSDGLLAMAAHLREMSKMLEQLRAYIFKLHDLQGQERLPKEYRHRRGIPYIHEL